MYVLHKMKVYVNLENTMINGLGDMKIKFVLQLHFSVCLCVSNALCCMLHAFSSHNILYWHCLRKDKLQIIVRRSGLMHYPYRSCKFLHAYRVFLALHIVGSGSIYVPYIKKICSQYCMILLNYQCFDTFYVISI